MPNTDNALKASEDFIRSVLEKNFNQQIDSDSLRLAATKLCNAMPAPPKKDA